MPVFHADRGATKLRVLTAAGLEGAYLGCLSSA